MILRRLAILLGLAGLALAVCYAWIGSPRPDQTGKVYTLSDLESRLARKPEQWLGRPLLVWALAEPCGVWGSPHGSSHCPAPLPVLADPDDTALTPPLPLTIPSGDSLRDALHSLPLVGSLLPLQAPRWDRPAIYRIRLLAPPVGSCADPWCYTAVLVDSAPAS